MTVTFSPSELEQLDATTLRALEPYRFKTGHYAGPSSALLPCLSAGLLRTALLPNLAVQLGEKD